MAASDPTMHNRLYVFPVFCAVIVASAEVHFTDRKAVLQIAYCSLEGREDVDKVTLTPKSPKCQDQWQASVNLRNRMGTANCTAIAVWGSLQDPTSLSAAYEQSDVLDMHGNDLTCKIFINAESTPLPVQTRLVPATRWEWRRPKGPADAQKKVSINVEFSYRGNLETARIPGQRDEADGTMKRFPAKTDDVILYRFLDNDRESLLVVLLPKALESSVENVHCRVEIDGHSSTCPGPNRTENAARGPHHESGLLCISVVILIVVGVGGVVVGAGIIGMILSCCPCCRKGKRQVQSSGPAVADESLPFQYTGSQCGNESSQFEHDHSDVSIHLKNALGVRGPNTP